VLAGICLLNAPAAAFTYQGRLHVTGDPAQGLYDMYFTVCDSAVKGQAVSETLKCYKVDVTNSYFTVELDFSPSAVLFNGQPRWLEIAIKPAGSKLVPEILSPRQPITAVPEAVHAKTADRLDPPVFISSYTLRMDIDGENRGYFHHMNEIGSYTEVVEYQDGEDRILRKRPGQTHSPDIELKCFARPDSFIADWFQGVLDSRVVRHNVQLSLIDAHGRVVDRWQMLHCWPAVVRYDHEARLDTVVMTIVLACESTDRVAIGAGEPLDPWFPGASPTIRKPYRLNFDTGQSLQFTSFSQIGTDVDIVKYNDTSTPYVRKRPGRILCLDPVFWRAVQQDAWLAGWRQGVLDGQVERKSPVLQMNNSQGQTVLSGTLYHTWPTQIKTSLTSAADIMQENVTFACEQFVLN
jgi:phage tail-like protein